MFVAACKDSDKKPAQPVVVETKSHIGVWNAPAYGWVFDIKDNSYTLYQTTSKHCSTYDIASEVSYSSLKDSIKLSNDKNSLVSTIGGLKIPGVHMTRESSLPNNCDDN